MRRPACAFLALVFLLSACASFDGQPHPVISTAQAQRLIASFDPDTVVAHMATLGEAERTNYRNRVIASYLMAADARYDQFRIDLSQNIKGGNLALDIAGLGMTSIAATWTKVADELAAAATFAAGGRASINRELYFEQTLPALLSIMDSKRLAVRAEILEGMAQQESDYSIHEAFADLWRYQSAASIDGAIQQVAADAAEGAKQAKIDFSKAVKLCRPPTDIAARRHEIMFALEDEAEIAKNADGAPAATAARTKIQKALIATGKTETAVAPDDKTTNDQLLAVAEYLKTICSAETLNAYEAKVKEAGANIKQAGSEVQ